MPIGREFPFLVEISPEISREGTSEDQKSLDHFEAESPLMFTPREIFNILLSEYIMRHRYLYNKGKLLMEP